MDFERATYLPSSTNGGNNYLQYLAGSVEKCEVEPAMALYSIGHSNASLESFIGLLAQFEIELLVDARSRPYSRYNPQFNRETLQVVLNDLGVNYLFLGDKIGGKPANKGYLMDNGRIDYERLAISEFYLNGIQQLMALKESNRVCVMCAEADYKRCHRYWLITRTLADRGVEVKHILHSGKLAETQITDFHPAQSCLF